MNAANQAFRARRGGPAGDFAAGAGYLFKGVGWTFRNPRRLLFGMIPALIVLVVYAAGLVALAVYAGDLGRLVTPFADHWASGLRDTVRLVAALAIFGGGVFLAIVTYTGITLAVGEPFYERLSGQLDAGVPEAAGGNVLSRLARGFGDAIVIGLAAAGFSIVFFALGFLPFVGQTVVPVVAALVSGYFLTAELTGIPLERRGLRRRDRFLLLRRHRALALGFGTAAFVLFLIPFVIVLAMPGAVAGGTMIVRERLTSP